MKCIILEYPNSSIEIRGKLGPEMLSRFDGNEVAALQYILAELVPVQDPGAVNAEIVERSVLPSDRWFRDAWRWPVGGGSVEVDMQKAREIHTAKIQRARELKLNVLQGKEDRARLDGRITDADQHAADRAALETMNLSAVAASIAGAANPTALKAVWPVGLPTRE